ncbi:MAG: Zn-ribbon domain-containing OB-fold protein [Dehalococcoidia bacterium]|nr:MAG: Zn-ribbon domain-containing OB-fold protein [Dehalococcoidia bacterium]
MSHNIPEISEEPVIAEVVSHSNFQVSVGATGTKFLKEIRDNKTIMGIKCPSCKKVYVPPRSHCPICFDRMSEWVALSGKGSLTSYTIVRYPEPYMPKKTPYAYGIIQLDGADTGMAHFLGEVDLDKIEIGVRLEPVFKEEREGSILDIDYFKPSS